MLAVFATKRNELSVLEASLHSNTPRVGGHLTLLHVHLKIALEDTWRALAQTSRTICIYASYQEAAGPTRSQAIDPAIFSTSYLSSQSMCSLSYPFGYFHFLYLAFPPLWALGPSCRMFWDQEPCLSAQIFI